MNIIKFFIFLMITTVVQSVASFRIRRASNEVRHSRKSSSTRHRISYHMRNNYLKMIKPLYFSDNLFY